MNHMPVRIFLLFFSIFSAFMGPHDQYIFVILSILWGFMGPHDQHFFSQNKRPKAPTSTQLPFFFALI